MKINLGYWLDSATYPDALENSEAMVGTVVTGFNGLVGILETQLGLTAPNVSENIRIAEWQELIRTNDTGDLPFSKSYETDSWNTAKELLRRRDELVLAGWDPSVHVGGGKWLDTIAKLELSHQQKSTGFPDRVQTLLALFKGEVPLNIETITIVDDDQSLWEPWSIQLVDLLKKNGIQIEKEPIRFKKEHPTSDLSLLQSVLAGEPSAQEAQGDGSVLLIRSDQEWDAADFLISWLQENGTRDTVLIKGEGSLFLDELLHRRGVPGVGVDIHSKWRSVLQILPLTIDTYWRPLRVHRMMELLTIPASPIPNRIRSKLARALAAYPGIGGPQWVLAMEAGISDYEEMWKADNLDQKEVEKRRKNMHEKLDLWINHDYYDPNEGIPFEKLVHICEKVSQWAAVNYRQTDDVLYARAAQIAEEVIEGIRTLGASRVTHLQIARILDSVLGEGATLSPYRQEAAAWQVVQHPGQIWGQAETILWWGFHKNTSGPRLRTWTANETAWLRDHGIHLIEDNVQRLREATAWQRAAQMANRRLILFAPAKVNGADVSIHPLWDEIRFAIAKDHQTEKKIAVDAAELRKQPHFSMFGDRFEREPLSSSSIPKPLRTWQIPSNVVVHRKEESATSFETLIGCSLKWTFQYAANLRPGNLLSIPNESIMLGNLGHAVLEQLLMERTNWNEEDIKIRAGEVFDQLTPMLAAPLLEPKNEMVRSETRFQLLKSLQAFFKLVNKAGIEIHHTELEVQKSWSDEVEFKGRLDLVGQTATGKKVLLDAKWSKRPQNYKTKLEKLSVQLALYHWLLSDQADEEFPVAYFMLSTGNFFSRPHDEFPADYHVTGPSLQESYKVLRNAVNEVSTQLVKGTATAPGIPAEETSGEVLFVSPIEPPCSFCEYQNICGVRRVSK